MFCRRIYVKTRKEIYKASEPTERFDASRRQLENARSNPDISVLSRKQGSIYNWLE